MSTVIQQSVVQCSAVHETAVRSAGTNNVRRRSPNLTISRMMPAMHQDRFPRNAGWRAVRVGEERGERGLFRVHPGKFHFKVSQLVTIEAPPPGPWAGGRVWHIVNPKLTSSLSPLSSRSPVSEIGGCDNGSHDKQSTSPSLSLSKYPRERVPSELTCGRACSLCWIRHPPPSR